MIRPGAGWSFPIAVLMAATLISTTGSAAAPQVASRKGWIEALPGHRLDILPRGSRVVESYGERLFVELPADAVQALAAHGLAFQPADDADVLAVGAERFDARDGEPILAAELHATIGAAAKRPYLLKFDAPVKPEWLADLAAHGIELLQYQPSFGYLVMAPAGIERTIAGMRHVSFSGEYHAAYKAERDLLDKGGRDETISLRIVYFDLPDYGRRVDATLGIGARLASVSDAAATSQWATLHYVVYDQFPTKELYRVLRDPEVYWAEEWHPPQPEDERAAQIVAGNITASQPVTGYHAWLAALGADGTGVTVAVADTGLDTGILATLHGDLRNRTTFATTFCSQNRDRDGHGTNVAGIAVGDPRLPTGTGLTDPGGFFWGAGSAPGAHLYFQKALDSTDCPGVSIDGANIAQDAVKFGGAQIGSHSYTDGLTPGSSYTSQCQVWDARVRDADSTTAGNQQYAVVFSAGNSGPAASSLSSPHAAKNIISVGNSENFRPGLCPGVAGCGGSADDIDTLNDSSSRGPTTDGRIKPDVTAPGHVIGGPKSSVVTTYDCFCDSSALAGCCASLGVDGSNKYTLFTGTSQAAPRVAGASAIVFNWFKNRFAVFPSPAMDKAILIQGAVDMKALDVPNNSEGWGRINLKNSLQSPLATQFVDQSTVIGTTGDAGAFTASYVVQDSRVPVKATLAWTDAPGAASCNPCLVNDLDLLLTQGATTWRGNNFTAGFTNTGAVADVRNNIEGINLAGNTLDCTPFQMKVRATTLGGDGVPGNADTTDQDFALVVGNAAPSGVPVAALSSSAVGAGCDADAFLDRRETASLTLQIQNAGCAAAAGVQATLSLASQPAGASVTLSPVGAEAIGSIGAGATVPHVWQISLANSASSFCGQKARFRVDFTDSAAHAWSDFVDVVLDANGFSTITNTDNVNTDNSFSKDPTEWTRQACRTTSPTLSWHMGQTDCSGIVRDSSTRDLVFSYTVGASDVLKQLQFQHAFNGYSNASFNDMVEVDIDPENDGTFVTLASWKAGINAPATMTLAGPFDLTPYNAAHGTTIKVRFRFTGGANWVGGANTAAGWDVDDIVFKYDQITCDAGSCPLCSAPTGLTNNSASDPASCLASGNAVSWTQDASAWNDGAVGARTYTVLRSGTPVASGGCGGAIPYGTTSCTDTTAAVGTAYTYTVRYTNGCASSAATAGAGATDLATPPSQVGDGLAGTTPVTIAYDGVHVILGWQANA
ncbi:MAG: S8 family serine peptidase, partial [Acidobacteria bacterium]|nr:S8 family serine peptidase [Acidobacteriota bacterium]